MAYSYHDLGAVCSYTAHYTPHYTYRLQMGNTVVSSGMPPVIVHPTGNMPEFHPILPTDGLLQFSVTSDGRHPTSFNQCGTGGSGGTCTQTAGCGTGQIPQGQSGFCIPSVYGTPTHTDSLYENALCQTPAPSVLNGNGSCFGYHSRYDSRDYNWGIPAGDPKPFPLSDERNFPDSGTCIPSDCEDMGDGTPRHFRSEQERRAFIQAQQQARDNIKREFEWWTDTQDSCRC